MGTASCWRRTPSGDRAGTVCPGLSWPPPRGSPGASLCGLCAPTCAPLPSTSLPLGHVLSESLSQPVPLRMPRAPCRALPALPPPAQPRDRAFPTLPSGGELGRWPWGPRAPPRAGQAPGASIKSGAASAPRRRQRALASALWPATPPSPAEPLPPTPPGIPAPALARESQGGRPGGWGCGSGTGSARAPRRDPPHDPRARAQGPGGVPGPAPLPAGAHTPPGAV